MVLTDGSVYAKKDLIHGYSFSVCLGHKIDVMAFLRDIKMIVGYTPKDTFSKGVWNIKISASLSGSIGNLPGIQSGRRSSQNTSWPDFIISPDCPDSVLREFVGGLFGGDGHSPHIIDRSGIDGGANFLIQCAFSQTVMEGYLPQMIIKMNELSEMLIRLGVPNKVEGPFKCRYATSSYKPTDGIQRYEVKVKLETSTDFSDKVGFRYCIQKSCRLSAASSYWRLQQRVREQHDWVVNRTNEIYESGVARGKTNKRSITVALDMARKELIEIEPILNNHYSLSNINDVRNRRSSPGSRKNLSRFEYIHFPDVKEFFTKIGCLSWFTRNGTSPEYIVQKGSMEVPGFYLSVIDSRNAGSEAVYDIGVHNIHSFLANGVVAHNCIPSRMTIAKMIEIITSKIAAFSGERINATAYRRFDIKTFKQNLVQYGYSPSGKERLFSGLTGKPLEAEIFIGPCYYQALRHHVLDKIQMRARGAIKQLSHQPVGGRARKGGQRFGEMERDAIISHGASEFLKERLCGVSDAYKAVYCSTCGTIAISNPASNKFVCRSCGDDAQFGTCTIPYAYKLLTHMLAGAGFNLQFGMKPEQPKYQPLPSTAPRTNYPELRPAINLPELEAPGLAPLGIPRLEPELQTLPVARQETRTAEMIGLPKLGDTETGNMDLPGIGQLPAI
jgi:hypothetical protein